MDEDPTGTKLALIMAAGELFAERGLDGTGIRAIAEKANANIAAINYHFGSKEHLYTEAVLYAARHGASTRAVELAADDAMLQSQAGIARAIREIVDAWFKELFLSDEPPWRGRLLVRSMVEPAHLLEPVVKEVFKPDTEALMTIFRRAKPGMSASEALLWAHGLIGQFAFYMLAQSAVLALMEREEYDQEFLSAAAHHIVRSTVAALGLPEPE